MINKRVVRLSDAGLVIIDNFYAIGLSFSPEETHAKAVIYSNAVLAAAVSLESF